MKSITLLLCIGLAGMRASSYAASLTSPLNTHTGYADLGPGCHVRGEIPFDGIMGGSYRAQSEENGGGFSIRKFPKKYGATELQVNMQCFKIDDGRVNDGWAKFNEQKKQWEPRFINEEDHLQRHKVTKIYPIQALNSQGFVVTEDDLIGEEWRRDRNMHFCLLRPPKALCGDAPVMRLNDPKSNVLPYVLQILRSIEFIDDVPSEQPSVGPNASVRDQ